MNMMKKKVVLITGIVALLAGLSAQIGYAQESINIVDGIVARTVTPDTQIERASSIMADKTAVTVERAPMQVLESTLTESCEEEQDLTRSGQQLNNIWRRVNKIPNITQADQIFTQQEITAGPGVMIVKPGVYHLAENITFSNSVAITIASDDVVLDLTGRSIDGENTGRIAIQIKAGYKNITIMNGSIQGCTCAGIFADGSGEPKEQSAYESITIKNISISNLGLCDINSNPNELISILDDLDTGSIFDAIVEAGLGGQIDLLARSTGIFIDCARKVTIEECLVCNVLGDGFFLRHVTDAIVKESQAESNGADGFVFDNCDISTITACKAERNGLNGFHELACNGDNAYRSCTARQNGVHGFRIVGGGKIVEDCISNQNTLDGFNIVTPRNSTVDGSPDITFGTNGFVTTDFGLTSTADAIALQKDGKIVVAGMADNGTNADFALARYNPDGTLDTTFGGTGKVLTDFGGNDQANGVAIQEDGKIVAAGYSDAAGVLEFALARYNVDGTLDPDFNQGSGLITTNLSPFQDGSLAVVIQEDGKIIAVGAADDGGGNFDFAVVRYTSHGELDTTFNGTGFVTTDLGGTVDVAFDVALQRDGKIIAVGFSNAGGLFKFAAVRYNTDGSLDTSFGVGGIVTTSFVEDAQAQAIALQKDGKIILAGATTVSGSPQFALVRYHSDGSVDTSFGTAGKAITSFPGNNSFAFAVTIQTDGKIIAEGTAVLGGQNFVALARYTTEGSLDLSFGAGIGQVLFSTGSGYDVANAAVIDAQGKLVITGADAFPNRDFLAARFNIFKRCSMIKDSTAQANGRDGFNLQDAYEVAVLGNQASCNTRNGFVASSPTDNNLYNNLSYDNTANYVSATDLTVKPDEVSSFWANVDPDKSVFDCNLCSLVEVIDSKVDILLNTMSFTDSSMDNVTPCILETCSLAEVINNKIDNVISEVELIDSKADVIDSGIEVLDSKIDILIARDCCDCEHFIYQADIPYVITEPGIYCLAESVTNTGLNDFLITVSSNDVVLELGEHLMDGGTQDGLSQGATNGILVQPGMQNISIKNGTLSNFAQYAINVGGVAGSIEQVPVESLTIEDVEIIDISQFLPSTADQLDLIGSTLDAISAVSGFDKVLECCLGDEFSRVKTAAGIFINYANKVTIQRCSAYNTQGDGFFLRYVQEALVKDCESERNGGSGFVLDNCDVSCVNGCKAEQNSFNGFYEVSCNGDNSYENCSAKQNGVHGFRIIGGGKTFEDCIANQNTLDGFYVVTPQDSTVDGSLDITFGIGGVVETDFNSTNDQAFATLIIQPDNKIVAAGFSSGSGVTNFALARYTIDGSLDTSFGGTGKVTTSFGGTDAQAFALAIQEDGKIIAGGRSNSVSDPGNFDFALARYNNDGSLDASFGVGGQVITDLGGSEWVNGLAIQEDGKIIAAGFSDDKLALVRYNSDGSLDTSFNGTGIVITLVVGGSSVARAVEIQQDGRIVIAGNFTSGTFEFLMARYNMNGSLDTNFGSGGIVLTSFGGSDDEARALKIQKDGALVAAGYTNVGGGYDFALARYNTDGSLDNSFGTNGKVITDLGGTADQANALVIQKDGKLIAIGFTNTNGVSDFALVRYTTDGSLDTGFNGSGIVITNINGSDIAYAAALQDNGKLVAAGGSLGIGGVDFSLARYNIFKRCSTIRESIAQANGRDGFNLECAFNVALVNSEASCNERNGFSGSSTTANNLYSNVSYNNITNYYSVTDLTVKPDETSSYWGNVDPDKSVFDCNLCSLVEVIDSTTQEIASEIDTFASCIEHTCSVVDVIEDKVDTVISEVEVIDSKIDALASNASCSCQYSISQADIPYTITSPGIYCLTESVTNTGLNDFLITVSSSNVVLDLQQYMMDGGTLAGCAQGALDGIVVYPGSRNVTIKNGTIANFAQYGINASIAVNPNIQTPIECLTITDIKLLDLNEFLPSVVDQPDIITSKLDILELISGFDAILETDLGDQYLRVKKAAGMYIDNANQVTIERCQAFNIQGDGFYLRYVQEGILKTCESDRNGGNGFVLENCNVSCIESCKAEQNDFNGFQDIASNGDNTYKGCTAKENGVDGFRIVGAGKVVDSCIANQNTLDGFNMVTPQVTTEDGSLDITFNGTGTVITDVLGGTDAAYAVAIQKDGKIVVAGSTINGGTPFFVTARYNTDGSLDMSFGSGGFAFTNFGGTIDGATAVAIQNDGKIVVAGTVNPTGNQRFAIARYMPDGTLDSSFGAGGTVIVPNFSEGSTDTATSLTIEPCDNAIIVAGYTAGETGGDFALVRYNTNGTIDTSFGGMGQVTTDFGGRIDEIHAITLQDDGKIVAVGTSFFSGNNDFALARYNIDGSLDTSFNPMGPIPGTVITDIGNTQDIANAVAMQKDNKIVVAGYTSSGIASNPVIARYNTDGALDANFNGTGIVIGPVLIGTFETLNAVEIQSDGKIVAAGSFSSLGVINFFLLRYLTDGTLDISFGIAGSVQTDFGSNDTANALAIQKDGKLVAVGTTGNGSISDFALARYNVFKRCSTIRNSIAQANGRDGFNLVDSTEVAVTDNEASCNSNAGFESSSSSANTLLGNLGYDNATNFLSVTSLAFAPGAVLNPVANIDPTSTTIDPFVSQLSTMDALLNTILLLVSP